MPRGSPQASAQTVHTPGWREHTSGHSPCPGRSNSSRQVEHDFFPSPAGTGPVLGQEASAFAENILERLDRVEDQLRGIGIAGQLPFPADAVLCGHGIKVGNRMVQREPQVEILIDGAPVRFVEPEADPLYVGPAEERRARGG